MRGIRGRSRSEMTGAAPGRDYRDQCSPAIHTGVRRTSPEHKTKIESHISFSPRLSGPAALTERYPARSRGRCRGPGRGTPAAQHRALDSVLCSPQSGARVVLLRASQSGVNYCLRQALIPPALPPPCRRSIRCVSCRVHRWWPAPKAGECALNRLMFPGPLDTALGILCGPTMRHGRDRKSRS